MHLNDIYEGNNSSFRTRCGSIPKRLVRHEVDRPQHSLVEVDVTTVNKDLNVSGEVADGDAMKLPVADALQSSR